MVVDVAWHAAERSADEALVIHLRDRLGNGTASVGRLCGSCGSIRHGRPWARHGRHDVAVSVSRAGGHLVTALVDPAEDGGQVGVDVEVIADVHSRWDPTIVLAPGEWAADAYEEAWSWSAKEAALKARGTGLDVPMTAVRLTEIAGLEAVTAPPGLIAALARG